MTTDELLLNLRARGLSVGVHNDYSLAGVAHTFWLMTHPNGRYYIGEARTDVEALTKILTQVEGDGYL